MKKTLLYSTTIILSGIIIYSCGISDRKIAHNLYNKREYLLKEFKDKSIINRDKVFYQLTYHKGELVNTFFFERQNDIWVLTDDTLQYSINDIAPFASINISDRLSLNNALGNELSRLLKVMDSFNINNVSAEFVSVGVDMKIYFGDYQALIYVGNTALITNERWRNYIKSGKKLDEYWYLVKDEL